MKRLSGLVLSALLCSFALAVVAGATSVVICNDEQMVISARAIITAKVLKVATRFDTVHGSVYTYTTLRVGQVLKGNLTPDQEVVLKEEGGVCGEHQTALDGRVIFTPGSEVLVYLDTRHDGTLRVHQMFLGKFSIVRDPATGAKVADRGSISSEVSVRGRADGVITDRMNLNKYIRMVAERVSANQSVSNEFQAKYYSNVPMLAHPSEYDPATQRNVVEPEFSQWPTGAARWPGPDSGKSVEYIVNGDMAPQTDYLKDIQAAMNAWESVPGTSIKMEIQGPTDGCFTTEWVLVLFDGCDDRFSPSIGCNGILGFGGVNTTASQTMVVNGTTFNTIVSGYMSFNPYSACSFTTDCDLEEVATHEMGHSVGLAHSWQPGFTTDATVVQLAATMFYAAHFDGRCAAVETDDMNGIIFNYPATLSITTGSTLAPGMVGAAYTQPLVAAGTAPYTWSIASGQLPPGLTLSQTGGIIGSPRQDGTFKFTLQVLDGAGHTAQNTFSITISVPTLSMLPATLPYGIQGTAYSQQLTATGGLPPYTWSVGSGALPAGVILDPSLGAIAGTPTGSGNYSFTAAVTDSDGRQVNQALSMQVIALSAIPVLSNAKFKTEVHLLKLTGLNFASSAQLFVDGASVTMKTESPTGITAKLKGLAAGTHQVWVVNPDVPQIPSNHLTFTTK